MVNNLKLSKSLFRDIFFLILAVKLIGYGWFSALDYPELFPNSDANLYHAIATGMEDVNFWGNLLKLLNDYELYSRRGIALGLFIMNCVLLPWLLVRILVVKKCNVEFEDWGALIFISIFPTLIFFSTDIYREALMVALYLIVILFVKNLMSMDVKWHASQINLFKMMGVCAAIFLLFKLRFYLIASIALSIVAAYVFDCSRRPLFKFLVYIFILWMADQVGVFDALKGNYRAPYETAGSRHGIDYSSDLFLIAFFKSFLGNIYGFNFSNLFAYILFIFESMPALLLSGYIVMNLKYMTRFTNFLIFFFFIYAAAWNVACDSLGTAARLRIFNLLSLLIVAVLLYKEKCEARSLG